MPALLLSLPGQSGEKFDNVQPPKFTNFVWDIDTVKIASTGDETLEKDDDGDEINASLVNPGIEISGTLKIKSGATIPYLHGWFLGKAGGSMDGTYMQVRSLEVTEVIGTDKRPSKIDVTLAWSQKMNDLIAADTGITELDA